MQSFSYSEVRRLDCIVNLVTKARQEQHWRVVENALLQTEQTTMGDEGLDIWMSEDVLLGTPLLKEDIVGLVLHRVTLPLPDNPLFHSSEDRVENLPLPVRHV